MQHTSSVSQNDITLLEQYHKIWSSFDQQEAENITQHPIPNGKHQPQLPIKRCINLNWVTSNNFCRKLRKNPS
jgi:hypothetical protein